LNNWRRILLGISLPLKVKSQRQTSNN
jgi:hypothetical protein